MCKNMTNQWVLVLGCSSLLSLQCVGCAPGLQWEGQIFFSLMYLMCTFSFKCIFTIIKEIFDIKYCLLILELVEDRTEKGCPLYCELGKC